MIGAELAAAVRRVDEIDLVISGLRDNTKRLEALRVTAIDDIVAEVQRAAAAGNWGARDLLAAYTALKRPLFFTAWIRAGLTHPLRLKFDIQKGAA